MHRWIIFAAAGIFAATAFGTAQQESRSRSSDHSSLPPPLFYFEPICLPSDSSGMSTLDIAYRISYDFLVFAHDDQSAYPFSSNLEVSVELLNSQGNSVARRLFEKEVGI